MTATESKSKSGRLSAYKADMRYMWHVIFRPFDGFWDMAHEGKGSLAAATTYLVLFLITYVGKFMLTNFQFVDTPVQYINVFEEVFSILLPFLLLITANWGLTTLFDGKGRFQDIYKALCYALAPYVIIQLPLILVSNIITFDEASFYYVLMSISLIWVVFLAFVALMQVHDYGPGKTVIFLIATVVGLLIIIFLILAFFSLLSDAASYFVSLAREIMFRMN